MGKMGKFVLEESAVLAICSNAEKAKMRHTHTHTHTHKHTFSQPPDWLSLSSSFCIHSMHTFMTRASSVFSSNFFHLLYFYLLCSHYHGIKNELQMCFAILSLYLTIVFLFFFIVFLQDKTLELWDMKQSQKFSIKHLQLPFYFLFRGGKITD